MRLKKSDTKFYNLKLSQTNDVKSCLLMGDTCIVYAVTDGVGESM